MPAILDQYGRELKSTASTSIGRPSRAIAGRFDGAQTTSANSAYWSAADGLSARAAHSPAVRKILRERARYEVANNCYAKGMLTTRANYIAGTGPGLQVLTNDKEFNDAVETAFHLYCIAANIYEKLWTMIFAQGVDGESFGMFVENYGLRNKVKVDLHLLECDQVSDGVGSWLVDVRRDDGLILDDFGNIIGYRVLRQHPGDYLGLGALADPETVPARDMIHLYRVERPGQTRGVTMIAPALMLYPNLRRWTYAALSAAEKAARVAGVIKSTYNVEDAAKVDPLEAVDLEADTWLTMPEGWDITQLKAEQPTTTYPQFKREIVSEIARCLEMPYNVAAADSAGYNFASGKLDHSGWFKSVGIDQSRADYRAATPIFERWYEEAIRIPGHLPPPPTDSRETPPHVWRWDGQDLIDPREANAQATALANGFATLPRLYSKRGLDWADELNSQAKALGMTLEELQALLRKKIYGETTAAEAAPVDDEEDDEPPQPGSQDA